MSFANGKTNPQDNSELQNTEKKKRANNNIFDPNAEGEFKPGDVVN